jgi:tetratricopeptide (TPR) repeat protein
MRRLEPTPLQVAINAGSKDAVAVLADTAYISYTALLADPRFVRAQVTLKPDELNKAYNIFTELFKKEPGNPYYNFALGLTAFATHRYPFASLAYERVLAVLPDNQQVRLELGRCYLASEQFGLAKSEFNKVLASSPPQGVRDTIDMLVRDIRQNRQPNRHVQSLSVAFFHDSNVNVGPNSDVISISPILYGTTVLDQLTVNEDTQPLDSMGMSAALILSSTRELAAPGAWAATGAFNLYRSLLESKASDFELMSLGLSGGLKHDSRSAQLRLPLRYEHVWQGDEDLVEVIGVSPSWIWAPGERKTVKFATSLALEDRSYSELSNRDGEFIYVSETVHWQLTPKDKVSFGASYFSENAAEDVYSNDGYQLTIDGQKALAWQETYLYGAYSIRFADYKDREVLAPEVREDEQTRLRVGMRRLLNSQWGVDLNVQMTRTESTFDLFDSDRDVITLRTMYMF